MVFGGMLLWRLLAAMMGKGVPEAPKAEYELGYVAPPLLPPSETERLTYLEIEAFQRREQLREESPHVGAVYVTPAEGLMEQLIGGYPEGVPSYKPQMLEIQEEARRAAAEAEAAALAAEPHITAEQREYLRGPYEAYERRKQYAAQRAGPAPEAVSRQLIIIHEREQRYRQEALRQQKAGITKAEEVYYEEYEKRKQEVAPQAGGGGRKGR